MADIYRCIEALRLIWAAQQSEKIFEYKQIQQDDSDCNGLGVAYIKYDDIAVLKYREESPRTTRIVIVIT